jgi:ubiquinone/menaquinone biosynthesis C-methylase UbiE
MKQWYEEMFENSAKKYDKDLKRWYEKHSEHAGEEPDKEPHVKGTVGEVDFIECELAFDKNTTILDIGCGNGRHAIELAKRGYAVTAVDLSESQLDQARLNAAAMKVNVQFVKADARYLEYSNQFDAVIMVDSAFGAMETDEMNFEILKHVSRALRQRGVFILVAMNGLYPLFHSVTDYINAHCEHDIIKTSTFDLMTFRDTYEYEYIDDNGNKHILKCSERYYVPPEINWLLKTAGFAQIDIYAAELGKWRRGQKLTTEDLEILAVAKKANLKHIVKRDLSFCASGLARTVQ